MKSYQNMLLLQNLYRLKSLGYNYIDPFSINEANDFTQAQTLDELHRTVMQCHLCDLSKSRKQSMSGFGNPHADVMIVDFNVSAAQDSTNDYYSGRSGEVLSNMIENVLELRTQECYITHCVKCKAHSANRPTLSEYNSCNSYLFAQLDFIKPKIIITLGDDAYAHLTQDRDNFENVRGHLIDFYATKLIPIYHPAHLLKNPELKKATLADLNTIKSYLKNYR